jgi:hypothetical protein
MGVVVNPLQLMEGTSQQRGVTLTPTNFRVAVGRDDVLSLSNRGAFAATAPSLAR